MKHNIHIALFLIILFPPIFCNAQNTREFTGKLVSFNGNENTTKNVSVRLVNLGSGVSGTDGIFTIGINENVEEVTLELVNSNLNIIYPSAGKVSVPKSTNAVVEFVIGDSPKDILTKAVAKSNNEIKNRLSELGIQQDGIEETLNSFLQEIQKLSDIKRSDLNNQIDLASKREEFYPQLAASINDYINEAKDLKDAFKFTARHAFDDKIALQILTETIESYNSVFEDLNKKHTGFEKKVADYWQSEVKADEVSAWFNYALGEIHSANIYTLNLKVTDINDLSRRNIRKSQKEMMEEIILRDIESSQLQLERRLEELDKRAQVLLTKLAT